MFDFFFLVCTEGLVGGFYCKFSLAVSAVFMALCYKRKTCGSTVNIKSDH